MVRIIADHVILYRATIARDGYTNRPTKAMTPLRFPFENIPFLTSSLNLKLQSCSYDFEMNGPSLPQLLVSIGGGK